MSSADDIDQSIKKLRFTTSPTADERILADASAALAQARRTSLDASRLSVWRIIMKSHWTKLGAAAAVIVAAAVLFPIALDETAAPAYAIEQTIEANRAVRSIQVKFEPAGRGIGETWAEFDDAERLLRMRMDFPNTPRDGAKTVVWQDGKALIWFRTKGGASIVYERNPMRHFGFRNRLRYFNPKVVTESLLEMVGRGKTGLAITEPTKPGEPIVLTVTEGKDRQLRRVYRIDPKTKLLRELETSQRKGDRYEFLSRVKYVAYNASVDPAAFSPKLPESVLCVDRTAPDLGLPKGDLRKDQIAAEVVRAFFDALIAKEYVKAGKLCGGMPGERIRKSAIPALRVVSIGQPFPHARTETAFICVPCEIEVEADGVRAIKKCVVNVRPIYGQRDRWAIASGNIWKKR